MKRCFSLFLACLLLLTGCSAPPESDASVTVACTTYPVYLLAQALTEKVEGVTPVLVIDQQVSCLHDYTLTMQDMKVIESADLLAINGGGMEEFLEDILESRDYLDCSAGLNLSAFEHDEDEEEEEHEEHGHGHEHEEDCHFWLNPTLYGEMAETLAEGLCTADPDHADTYHANAETIVDRLDTLTEELNARLNDLTCRELITFHDGFHYFADAFGLTIAAAVEEEEGSEASARRIVELTQLIDQYSIPAVFTEVNGSDSTAIALSYERGTRVAALNLGMSSTVIPEGLHGLDAYEYILRGNVDTILTNYND